MSVSRLDDDARAAVRIGAATVGAALIFALAGCASTQTVQHYAHGHEHFSQAKYGHASPKVVADGQPVPRGGGQYLVGHPYRVAGHTYYPAENTSYTAVGMASWYGAAFHGRRTANGEVYDMASLTAAHPTMPLPSYARVTNLSNGYSIVVRVNDRGPYHGGRVMDVSSRTADVLGFKGAGTAKIKVEYVGRAPMEGSDDGVLLASLRTDGSPANLNGYSAPPETMVASAAPEAPAPTIFTAFASSTRAPPPPEPAPQPVQVAAAEPAAEPDAPPPPAVAVRQPHGPVPIPPPRPFDLGSIARPAVVVASIKPAPSAQVAVLPPVARWSRRARRRRKRYIFPTPSQDRLKRATQGAFDRVKPPRSSSSGD